MVHRHLTLILGLILTGFSSFADGSETYLKRSDYQWMLRSRLPLFDAGIELFNGAAQDDTPGLVSSKEEEIKKIFQKHLGHDQFTAQKLMAPCPSGDEQRFGWSGWIITTADKTKIALRHDRNNGLRYIAVGWSAEKDDTLWFCRPWYSTRLLWPFRTLLLVDVSQLGKYYDLSTLLPEGTHFGEKWRIVEEFSRESREGPLSIVTRNPDRKSLEKIYAESRPKILAANTQRVPVAVFDSGVDYNHPAIAYKLDQANHRSGWDFIERDAFPFDYGRTEFFGTSISHGTAVASIAAGDGIVTSVVPVRILGVSENNSKPDLSAQFEEAVEYAKRAGVRVINMSYGMALARRDKDAGTVLRAFGANDENIQYAIENNKQKKLQLANMIKIMRKNPDILFVVAAGNLRGDSELEKRNADDNSTLSYQGNASIRLPNVLVVASTKIDHTLSDFSVYGKKSVHLAAFGDLSKLPVKDSDNKEMAGTSFAAPFVANSAAYVLAQRPHFSIEEVVAHLKKSIVPTDDLRGKLQWGGYLDRKKLESLLK